MAITAAVEAPGGLPAEAVPVVDLRYLSQSELNALSLCSADAFDPRRTDDLVVPKIDRSVFNESAGSRKQTYSRLRLAPRPSDSSPVARRRRRLLPETPAASLPSDPAHDTEKAENKRIVQFLRELFDRQSPGRAAAVSDNAVSQHATNADGSPSTAIVVYDSMQNKISCINTPNSSRISQPESVDVVNKRGVIVDLEALEHNTDLFGDELRRRTRGLDTEVQLLDFLKGLNGAWGSRRKKRKVVDADDFGDDLPRGWKVILGLKRKEGRAWVYCRRFLSPNGQQFASSKEVALYLRPFIGTTEEKNTVSSHVDVSSNGTSKVVAENQPPAVSAQPDCMTREVPICYAAVPISSIATHPGQQVVLFKVENPAKALLRNLLECRKCNLTFADKDSYVQHLMSVHQRNAKRTRLGKSVSDGVIMNDGKYECQFCHKIFDERRRYNGHVGIHVRNYGKSLEEIPDEIIVQTSVNPSVLAAIPPVVVPQIAPGLAPTMNNCGEDKSKSVRGATSASPVDDTSRHCKQEVYSSNAKENAISSLLQSGSGAVGFNAFPGAPSIPISSLGNNHVMGDGRPGAVVTSAAMEDEQGRQSMDHATPASKEVGPVNTGVSAQVILDQMSSPMDVDSGPTLTNSTHFREKETHQVMAGENSGNIGRICKNTLSTDSCAGSNDATALPVNLENSICEPWDDSSGIDDSGSGDTHAPKEQRGLTETVGDEAFTEEPVLYESRSGNMCDETDKYGNTPVEPIKSENGKCGSAFVQTEDSGYVLDKTIMCKGMLYETQISENEVGVDLNTCFTTLSVPEHICGAQAEKCGNSSSGKFEKATMGDTAASVAVTGIGFRSSSSSSEKIEEAPVVIIANLDGEKFVKAAPADNTVKLIQSNSFATVSEVPNKERDECTSGNLRLNNMAGFDALKLEDIGLTKFDFATTQDSRSPAEQTLDISCGTGIGQVLGPSVQFGWDADLSKMAPSHQLTTVCVWCRLEFNHEGIDQETQSDSVGFMCPTCKAKISGQLTILEGGLSL